MNEKWNGDKPIYLESRSISTFKDKDAVHLRGFANDMNMEPLVAFVVVFQERKKERGNSNAYLFLLGLDHLLELRNDPECKFVNYTKNDFRFSFGDDKNNMPMIRKDPLITRFEMEITDYSFSEDFGNRKDNTDGELNKEHWKKQQGNFGEHLALWYLGMKHRMRGYHVDSTGADLILLDPEDKKDQYAVSVKTFTYQSKECYEFEAEHKNKLIEFARKWSDEVPMEPMLCFNLVCPDRIYLMAFTLDHVRDLEEQGLKYIKYNKSGNIEINYNDASLEKIKNDNMIIFREIRIG